MPSSLVSKKTAIAKIILAIRSNDQNLTNFICMLTNERASQKTHFDVSDLLLARIDSAELQLAADPQYLLVPKTFLSVSDLCYD